MNTNALLPRARLSDVLRGRSPLVGARMDPHAPRGFVSPVEARLNLGIPYGDLAEDERASLATRNPLADAAALARAALTSLLAQPAQSEQGASAARPYIVSARVDNVRIDEALELLLAEPPRDRARMVHFVHPHALNVATRDRDLQQSLERADLVLPDGVGVRIGARVLGHALAHNVNGTDLFPMLCREAHARGIPIALVGAKPGVAAECATRMGQLAKGLAPTLVSHGYLDDEGARAFAARVRALGRSIVLVGMGTPQQERWAWRYLKDIGGCTVVTVGGLFDFYSDRIPRAPLAWRELGLEWLFRLRQEPTRLARRYLVGNPLFLARVAAQRAHLTKPPPWNHHPQG